MSKPLVKHKRTLTSGFISGDIIALCGSTRKTFDPILVRQWASVTCKLCLKLMEKYGR